MITDKETYEVFLSTWLKKSHSTFFDKFTTCLNENNIKWRFIGNTADIWCRDYMPIQIEVDEFVQYHYYPDYLTQRESYKKYITKPEKACKSIYLSPCKKTNLVIDGGNVVKGADFVIMTEKVYHENPNYNPSEIHTELENLFQCKVIMLPWDKCDKYGHADGIVRPIDSTNVLLTNYTDYDKDFADEVKRRLSKHMHVEMLHYDVKKPDKRNWAYINFLQVGETIILPAINIEEDDQALKQIQGYYPSCDIHQLNCEEIIKQGGALNCITWNVHPSDEIKGFTEEDRKRFDELINRFESEEEATKAGLFSGFTESEVDFMGDINLRILGEKYPDFSWYYMID